MRGSAGKGTAITCQQKGGTKKRSEEKGGKNKPKCGGFSLHKAAKREESEGRPGGGFFVLVWRGRDRGSSKKKKQRKGTRRFFGRRNIPGRGGYKMVLSDFLLSPLPGRVQKKGVKKERAI